MKILLVLFLVFCSYGYTSGHVSSIAGNVDLKKIVKETLKEVGSVEGDDNDEKNNIGMQIGTVVPEENNNNYSNENNAAVVLEKKNVEENAEENDSSLNKDIYIPLEKNNIAIQEEGVAIQNENEKENEKEDEKEIDEDMFAMCTPYTRSCWRIFEYPGSQFYVKGLSYSPKSPFAFRAKEQCYSELYELEEYQAAASFIKDHYGCNLRPFWKERIMKRKYPFIFTKRHPEIGLRVENNKPLFSKELRLLDKTDNYLDQYNIRQCQKSAVTQICISANFVIPCLMMQFNAARADPVHKEEAMTDLAHILKEVCTVYSHNVLHCGERLGDISPQHQMGFKYLCEAALKEIGDN